MTLKLSLVMLRLIFAGKSQVEFFLFCDQGYFTFIIKLSILYRNNYKAVMKGKSPCQSELNLFEPILRQTVERNHPLIIMGEIFPWKLIETEYSSLYSDKGAPAKPVRLMAGLLILKHIFSGSDDGIVNEWKRDPYFQYFCGENILTGKLPCDPSDLAHFRRRIGHQRLIRLMYLSATFQKKSGVDRLKIDWEIKPGQDHFSYEADRGFYQNLRRTFSGLADTFSRILSH
jgi:hypothetical protein